MTWTMSTKLVSRLLLSEAFIDLSDSYVEVKYQVVKDAAPGANQPASTWAMGEGNPHSERWKGIAKSGRVAVALPGDAVDSTRKKGVTMG